MPETKIDFPCGDLTLEGVVSVPEGSGPFPAVVVCHPHPLYGGMMDNNVVIPICRSLVQASIAALRFNFRGVGGSQGQYADGVGEQDDAAAALSFVSSNTWADPGRIGLCGYSFGASVALDVAAADGNVMALALVSPVLSHPSPVETYARPKLLIWGSQDIALPTTDFERFTEGLPEPKEYEVFAGADHFWWGHEGDMASRVVGFFAEALKAAQLG